MSDHSLKRNLFFCLLFLSVTSAAFAGAPSARYETRMVWDVATHRAVLFGGLTAIDSGTKLNYDLGDTWEWTGSRWIERFPAHSPAARSSEAMVYDSARSRVVIFGGRNGRTNLNDTWSYDGNDWKQIPTANAPSVREGAGAAYDSTRDRIVLFGGTVQTYPNDAKTVTETQLHDTWEFDGTNWHQILADGPDVTKPRLEYDPIRKQTIMIGFDTKVATVMYAYDPAAAKWNQLTPATLPACGNDGSMTWQSSNNTILYTGSVCANSVADDETYEWDGTNWTKIALTVSDTRAFGSALTFDPDRQVAVLFGGAPATGVLLDTTFTYANKAWASVSDAAYPIARSLFVFTTDPVHNVIDLFGGVNDSQFFADFWSYQNGQFRFITDSNQPTDCTSPIAAFDTDRKKMVVLCATSATWEYDGTTWTQFDATKTAPPGHRFSSLVYDQSLKKIVFFGGYDTNYLNQTWTYDGTAWTQVKKNPPPPRSHTAMWYDPILKKTVIYGGLGRLSSTDVVQRFSDMWSFDGTGWTEIKPATTPGMRYGAEVAVDPKTNHAIVFGGVRVDTDAANNKIQVYANDTWDWDGTNWTKVVTAVTPPPHENGGFAVDPLRNDLVLFGGYSGFYLSDLWRYSNGNWSQVQEVVTRRRAAH
jgi:N-acetylneuraminic acid mutarotase